MTEIGISVGGAPSWWGQNDVFELFEEVATTGATTVRCDFRLETAGIMRQAAIDHGLKMHWLINPLSNWAVGDIQNNSANAWELGNEPNLGKAVADSAITSYAVAVTELARKIRFSDQEAILIGPGVLRRKDDSTAFRSDTEWARLFGEAGGFDELDAAGYHPYCSNPTVRPSDDNIGANGWQRLDFYANEVHRHADIPVMVTEQGWSTFDTANSEISLLHAEAISEFEEYLGRGTVIGPLFVYSMRDTGTSDYESQFGLLRTDSSPKPQYDVIVAAEPPAEPPVDNRDEIFDSLDARLEKMQSVGATILSNASYARRELEELR